MTPSATARYPVQPPSEVEWEDLLVRIEVMPRALRFALDDVGGVPGMATALLEEMASREAGYAAALDRATGGGEAVPEVAQPQSSQGDALDRFVRHRRRSFAIVQRRGIDVWTLTVELPAGAVSIFQALSALADEDVQALGTLRRLPRTGAGVC